MRYEGRAFWKEDVCNLRINLQSANPRESQPIAFRTLTGNMRENQVSAEARVQHLAERRRLAASILFRVCKSEENEMRFAEIRAD